jgi:hypothetical protein
VLPCTEQGIRNAVAAGDGPYTFDCAGPTTIETGAEIVIANDVVLDGEGELTVDGKGRHGVFHVPEGVTAELHGFDLVNGVHGVSWNFGTLTLTESTVSGHSKAGIRNFGQMTVIDSTIAGNESDENGGGIVSDGWMTLYATTVSGNSARAGGGIFVSSGIVTLINSTVSGNHAEDAGGGIYARHAVMLVSTTVSANDAPEGSGVFVDTYGSLESSGALLDGRCDGDLGASFSNGHNIESPGDTCGFDHETDRTSVSTDQLKLGPLRNNGGATETHALRFESVAIDVIPAEACVDADDAPLSEDQRGASRPFGESKMCDVGAFERQPDDAM